MGKETILKPIHRQFLEAVNKESYLTRNYYWTGGTVLSEFYLHHRESEDIDLFIEKKEVNLHPIIAFMKKFAASVGVYELSHKNYLGLESFSLNYKNYLFKVDFNYYPFPRIDRGGKWKNIEYDSLHDIAVNKVHTISTKPRVRDYVDLYFILKKENYHIQKLILDAKAKFDWHIDPIQLGRKFAYVVKLADYPRMLAPFNRKKMEEFFLGLARELEGEIFA